MSDMIKRSDTASEEQTKMSLGRRLLPFGLIAAALVVIGSCWWYHQEINRKMDQVNTRVEKVNTEIQEEVRKQINLTGENAYAHTDAYYMQLARARFHLIEEGDVVYVFR